jgi:hypothetical protein
MRASGMSETPIELDKHRGLAAQRATDIRRALADVEANAKLLREQQSVAEMQILSAPAISWAEAVAKAHYVLNLYSTSLAPTDTHHRDLVAAVLDDLVRLSKSPEPPTLAPMLQWHVPTIWNSPTEGT